jgi:hypothetical protein
MERKYKIKFAAQGIDVYQAEREILAETLITVGNEIVFVSKEKSVAFIRKDLVLMITSEPQA